MAATQYQDIKARIKSYQNLKEEFYETDIDKDEEIDRYIALFQQFNDEFLDISGELGVSISGVIEMTGTETQEFINKVKSYIGHSYVLGAEGDVTDDKGECFDGPGLIVFCMKELGLIPKNMPKYNINSLIASGYFNEVPWASKKTGDILVNNSMTNIYVYEEENKVIYASIKAPYSEGGVKLEALNFEGKAYRIKGYGVE